MAVAAETPERDSGGGTAQDVKRAREFYRYLEPHNLVHPRFRRKGSTFDVHHEHIPSLTSVLTPYCQLAAVRCNARKSMLNVVDRDIMYVIAEAYRNEPVPGSSFDFEFREDPILQSCASMPIKDRICEMTIELDVVSNKSRAPIFQILDLKKSKFSTLSVVAGAPYYRFYAGTPITTRDDIIIGSLAIMDTQPRAALSREEEDFLGQTAMQIMNYLETNRQAIEGRRSRRMGKALEYFIAGRRTIQETRDPNVSGYKPKTGRSVYGFPRRSDTELGIQGYGSDEESVSTRHRGGSVPSDGSEDSSLDETDDSFVLDASQESRSHSKTFSRAANLLREAFGQLGDDGGVVFLNLKGGLGQNSRRAKSAPRHRPEAVPTMNGRTSSEDIVSTSQPAPVLASSTSEVPFIAEGTSSPLAKGFTEENLRDLMSRYPGGHLWAFDEGQSSTDSDREEQYTTERRRSRRTRRRLKNEQTVLKMAFPGVRQLLMCPIWDPNIGSFAHAAFVAAILETRSLSATTDLSFLNSFCSTLMAECSRIDTMVADKQKDDFVGTISHEMRSPLHGILASVEFLADTELSGFQQSLVDTVNSCGHTLLDTINHVLDYSKINTFQKHWQSSNKRTNLMGMRKHHLGPESTSKPYSQGAPPLLQLFGVTNISAVLEEVIDGLVLGQTYSSGVDITDVSREARGRGSGPRNIPNGTHVTPEVEVFIDIEQTDWAFLTQPGAVRRIIQNLAGNALKYCDSGYIMVRLELKSSESEGSNSEVMRLTVKDTGRGISPEFLSTRLFVPFAQENTLAPGTGLGLSIVHSIVTMLGGSIDVQSQLKKGTTITVDLPLKRPLPGQQSTVNTPHSGGTTTSSNSIAEESVTLLQQAITKASVAIYRPRLQSRQDFLAQTLKQYVEDWYGLDVIGSELMASANVVITEEEDLDSLIDQLVGTPGRRPAVLVLCCVESRHSALFISSLEKRLNGVVDFLSKPCGPYKLAKSMRLVLEKAKLLRPSFIGMKTLSAISERPTPLPGDNPMENITENLQEMDLSGPGESNPLQVVQATETFAASQASQNAQMAINAPEQDADNASTSLVVGEEAFPFPDQGDTSLAVLSEDTSKEGSTELAAPVQLHLAKVAEIAGPPEGHKDEPERIDPRILIVDDNMINLRLLETFLKIKRKYNRVEKADDGQKAVDAVTSAAAPFEIIFMDISMPVMNGFEATRAIRDFEEQNQIKTGAMIIALTGLASGRDQAEGFDSGCDLYLTKPVSLKEVGKLLNNWEAHQRIKGQEQINGTEVCTVSGASAIAGPS